MRVVAQYHRWTIFLFCCCSSTVLLTTSICSGTSSTSSVVQQQGAEHESTTTTTSSSSSSSGGVTETTTAGGSSVKEEDIVEAAVASSSGGGEDGNETCRNNIITESSAPQNGNDDDDDDDDDDDEEEEDQHGAGEGYYWDLNHWGRPQLVELVDEDEIVPILEKMTRYMNEVVFGGDPEFSEGKYECRNYQNDCVVWALGGSCETDREYMVENCSPACQTCDEYIKLYYKPAEAEGEEEDVDEDEDQPDAQKEKGKIQLIPWGVPQHMGETVPMETLQELLDATHKYMTESVLSDPEQYAKVMHECENKHPDCTYWAAQGYCQDDPTYMHVYCAPACHSCDQLDYNKRCPKDPNAKAAFSKTGDLNSMFQRIISDPQWAENYGPMEIVSSPETTGGPWIVTLDTFVSAEECARFIKFGYEGGYERSEDVAAEDEFDGTLGSTSVEWRTSTNAWCYEECRTDPITGPVHERIDTLTGIHRNHSEYYQILKYETGQFYEEHHDYIVSEWDRPHGPRILTVFMYLNDVEEGGGTHFGRLGITVQPKKGKVVIWPSVLDEDPEELDERTHHEALPVTKGMKYGTNAWIHLRDFLTQSEKRCV